MSEFNLEIYTLLNKVCRYCLNDTNDLKSIYLYNDVDLYDVTKTLIGIHLSSLGAYPTLICSECMRKLLAFDEFRQQCIESIEYLQDTKIQSKEKAPNIASEVAVKEEEEEEDEEDDVEWVQDKEDIFAELEVVDDTNAKDKQEQKKRGNLVFYSNVNNVDNNRDDDDDGDDDDDDIEDTYNDNINQDVETAALITADGENQVFLVMDGKSEKMDIYDDEVKQPVFEVEDFIPEKITERTSRHFGTMKKCKICGDVISNLEEHLNNHSTKQQAILSKIQKLVRANKVLAEERRCALCDKVFVNILEHFKTFHISSKISKRYRLEVVCDVCGIKTKYLESHLKTHFKDSVTCHICEKVYATKQSLQIHMKIHLNKREHKCKLCPSAFNSHNSLKAHSRSHVGEKQFTCSVCGVSYVHIPTLYNHMRTAHQGHTYNLKCKYCDKWFYSNYMRKRHERGHFKRTYECKFCSKILTSEMGYFQHMNRHSKENPYECDKCVEKFTRLIDYKRHCRKHLLNMI